MWLLTRTFTQKRKNRAKILLFYENKVLFLQICVSFWQNITFIKVLQQFLRNKQGILEQMRVIDTRPHRHGHPNSIRDNEHRKLKKLVHSRGYLRAERVFYHASIMLRCGLGYSWDIHRVFMGYTYVSVMCRLCIGYVSVTFRNRRGAKKEEKVHFFREKFGNVRGFLYLCRRKRETG